MRLTSPAIGRTAIVTSTTLYNAWANATPSDLNAGSIVGWSDTSLASKGATAPSNPGPGAIWYDSAAQLWMGFVDAVEGTGVSLWVSIGPDRFDEPMLAAAPIPPRSVVRLVDNRRVTPCPDAWARPFGVSLNDATAASGTWMGVCVEGITTIQANTLGTSAGWSASATDLTGMKWLGVNHDGTGQVKAINKIDAAGAIFSPGLALGKIAAGGSGSLLALVLCPPRVINGDNSNFTA